MTGHRGVRDSSPIRQCATFDPTTHGLALLTGQTLRASFTWHPLATYGVYPGFTEVHGQTDRHLVWLPCTTSCLLKP